MRHGDKHRKFNMPRSQRRALFSNLTNALLTHEQITITLPRAKELRTFADSMITFAKKGDLNSRRMALAFLRDNEVVAKLFSTLAERYKNATAVIPAFSRPASVTATPLRWPSSNWLTATSTPKAPKTWLA